MSAPFLWILLPGITASIMLLFNRSERGVRIAGMVVTMWLAWAAWILPVGEALALGPVSIKVSESLNLLGREFILADGDRGLVAVLYLLTFCWLAGAAVAKPGRLFAPLALMLVALLTAAVAVEPFLFAALILEVAVLIVIPLLSPPDQKPGRGVFRFLTFQTLGMPFILFTGWMLEGVEASPSNLDLVVNAGVLLGIGFAFLLAVFPFHSWIPMLLEESHPYVSSFIFFMLPAMVSVFALGFFDRYVWLRESPPVQSALLGLGAMMALAGGIWTAVEKHLGRIFGYLVVSEIGLILLSVGLINEVGTLLFFWLFLTRALGYLIWGVTLSQVKQRSRGSLRVQALRGLGAKRPLLAIGIFAAHFSLAGLPLLAGFPVRMRLLDELAGRSAAAAALVLLGNVGLLLGGLNLFSYLFIYSSPEKMAVTAGRKLGEGLDPAEKQKQLMKIAMFSAVMLVLLVVGIAPQSLLPILLRMGKMFVQIGG